MQRTNLNDCDVVVVGNYYAINGKAMPRINAAHAGEPFSSFLLKAFTDNPPEDYELLVNNTDSTVRHLVSLNLECYGDLSTDDCPTVRRHASFIRALHQPFTGYVLTPQTSPY